MKIFKSNKKGFIIIPTIGVTIAVLLAIIFGVPLMTWLLSKILWKLVGVFLVVIAAVSFLKGARHPLVYVMLISGCAMIIWNQAYDYLKDATFSIVGMIR